VGDEQPGKDQAHRRAEGVFDRRSEATAQEFGGYADDGFGGEPGGKGRGDNYRQRQRPSGDGVVLGVFHPSSKPQPDSDGGEEVEDDEGEEHGGNSSRSGILAEELD
jgi:hypothetical protein